MRVVPNGNIGSPRGAAPDVAFLTVVETAHEVRRHLKRLGLIAFCKTTGGSLHVVTPLDLGADPLDWKAARTSAHAFCAQLALKHPKRYVTTLAIKHRAGGILLDYLRNHRTATAGAPLSPRARPGATVSMPLTWQEVGEGLNPKRYTIASVPGLLARVRTLGATVEGGHPKAVKVMRMTGPADPMPRFIGGRSFFHGRRRCVE